MCGKCGGRLVPEWDELVCLFCGKRVYPEETLAPWRREIDDWVDYSRDIQKDREFEQKHRELLKLFEKGFTNREIADLLGRGVRQIRGLKLQMREMGILETIDTTAPRKCETFGCENLGVRMFQVAPGTTLWLCQDCIGKNIMNSGRLKL